ncbi:MAG: c-type cytochrome [Candidatus Tectomicrobia bacterium]|uniref:C-type cytochrome n=1 Tax=Tectimicrobiota bacterium TaxID=2528274 RepID=A0A932HY96_UNCTE|nr:c-type cytochrome [Candidatus Tectomicrobia bacterium]
MRIRCTWVAAALVCFLGAGFGSVTAAVAQAPSPGAIALGGRLYDKWWKAVPGAKEPSGDHPLWALQTTNKLKGPATWRCKECHGWDYRGKDGAYGSGSHRTGFTGLMAVRAKSVDQIKDALKGAANPKHNFSAGLDDAALTNLAIFLKHGLVDLAPAIDAKAKKPLKADSARGQQLSAMCAACHGPDGKKLNFGKPDKPEYVGTVAKANPWEFVHKVRTGHPGAEPPMPAGVELGWNLQDALDILAYSATLPAK